MSEAMSSVEIEDVLSSIRRLVSEDHRPQPKAAPAPKADDKLLLTPALRVVASAPEPAAARPAPLPRLHLGLATPPKEELVATLQRAVEAQDIEWESEVGDPLPQVARMEWTEDGWAAPGEPDDAPALSGVDPWDQTGPEADVLGSDPQPAPPTGDDAWVDDIWADQAEAEAVAELRDPDAAPADTFTAAPPQDQAAPRSGVEVTFDEQVLRDLVRDLLREELQGDMGERITRNVRKLVRAEISRMIASQDLD